jgi:hypothetical protein
MSKAKLASLTLALLAAGTSLVGSTEKPSRSRSAGPVSSNNLDGVWELTRYGVNCVTGQDLGFISPHS